MHESETIEIVRKKVVETCFEQKQNPKNELKTNETNRNETETGRKRKWTKRNNMDRKRK
jgi:hypothetical protein